MKRIIAISVMLVMVQLQICYAEQKPDKTISQLGYEYHKTHDSKQRSRIIGELRGMKPKTPQDLENLFNIGRSIKESDERFGANFLHEIKINENDKHLEDVLLKALDNPDQDIRAASVINLGTVKSKRAAPKLREIVNDFNAYTFKAARLVDRRKAESMRFGPGRAAISLGQIKDESSIPLLISRLYDLEDYGSKALAMMGRNAVLPLVNLARKEKDPEKAYARRALSSFRDKESFDLLLATFKNKKEDTTVREVILNGLMMNYDQSLIMKEIGDGYKDLPRGSRYTLVARSTKKESLQFLVWVVKNEQEESIVSTAIYNLGNIGDSSVVPLLLECLRNNRNEIRRHSATALEQITGKKYEWRRKEEIF